MQISNLKRVFRYDVHTLPDPGPNLSPAQVKDLYTHNFPELVNAEIEGPNVVDGQAVYSFRRVTGTKGLEGGASLPFGERLARVAAGQDEPLEDPRWVHLPEASRAVHAALCAAFDPRDYIGRHGAHRTLSGLPAASQPLLL